MINLKSDTARGGIDRPASVPVPDYIAGHFLWEAMATFRAAYAGLTESCHLGADQLESAEVSDDQAIRTLVTNALPQVERLAEALKRANLFSDGEVYDDLMPREGLAPRVETAS